MKRFFSILSAAVLLVAAVACETKAPEEEVVKDVVLSTPEVVELTSEAADFKVSIGCADRAAYKVTLGTEQQLSAEEVLEGGVALTFDSEGSYESAVEVAIALGELESEADYTLWVAAANKKYSKVVSLAFTTPATEPEPEPEPEPAGPEVEMSVISILDLQSTTAEFTTKVKYMDNLYYYVAPADEEGVTAEVVLSNGSTAWIEENTSWEDYFDVPFNASDLVPSTDYVVYAVAVNEHSQKMESLAFTTTNDTNITKTITFNPSEARVAYKNDDRTNHYLAFENGSYRMTVHLKNDGLAGRYEPINGDNTIFLSAGSYFSILADGQLYEELDEEFGTVDIYYNVVTGNYEIYASLYFKPNLSIELTYYGPVTGAESDEAQPYAVSVKSASAEPHATSTNVWYLTLEQDKNNTVTLALNTRRSFDYIPSGTYEVVADDNTTAKSIIVEECTMCVDNVRTTLGDRSVGVSSLTLEYDATTEQTWVKSASLYVKSGTTVVTIDECGPFMLYEEVIPEEVTATESKNLMIWATWYDDFKGWELDWSGDNYYGMLYFITGENSDDHLPEGRYYLSNSAPADGGYWLDCKKSYICKIRTSDRMAIVAESGSYFDVTSEQVDGQWLHNITGVIKTTNGLHTVAFEYTNARGSIY